MKEADYIRATNLARILVITATLREMSPYGVLTEDLLEELGRAAWGIQDLLSKDIEWDED